MTQSLSLAGLSRMSQLDFELAFFSSILQHHPDFLEALRAHANNLARAGRYAESADIDRRILALHPGDSLAHYNLACSYALLRDVERAFGHLRNALESGYRDFRFLREDKDLASLRQDPRFRKLLREFERR